MTAVRQLVPTPELDPKLLISQIKAALIQLDEQVQQESFRQKLSEKPITKAEAAEFLRISYKIFERRLADGHYPAKLIHRDNGTMLFFESELTQYLKSL
jgi:hypothetical protein